MQCEKGKAKYIFIHKCVVGLKTSLFFVVFSEVCVLASLQLRFQYFEQ